MLLAKGALINVAWMGLIIMFRSFCPGNIWQLSLSPFCTVGAKGEGRRRGRSNSLIMEELSSVARGVRGSVTGMAVVF